MAQTLIQIGTDRYLDVSRIILLEHYCLQKKTEGGLVPLWIVRFNISSNEKYYIAYFMTLESFNSFLSYVLNFLEEQKILHRAPKNVVFQKITKEMGDLFFGRKRDRTPEIDLPRVAKIAEARKIIDTMEITPEQVAAREAELKKRDELQRNKQNNDKYFNQFFNEKKEYIAQINRKKRYRTTNDQLVSDLDASTKAAAKWFKKKSKGGLPEPDDFIGGDEND